ncbi:MAG TPA: alpha/beta fold hydrolase [Candidatus Acidoferrales bacterium]|nr:alpha/beta fold hydrolase [Candidatus Acidoferrales bacterium]
MLRAIRIAIAVLIGIAAGSAVLAENAFHVWNHNPAMPASAQAIARQGAASWHAAGIAAGDGVPLKAWIFTPQQSNGAAVILLHGVADTRMGMSGHAPYLLRAGYTVLLPDSRGHGESGGSIISYGVRESGDIHRWADLMLHEPGVGRLYGLGQSMGAAILIESLAAEPRFRALVADCPFATFEEIAYDRLAQRGLASRMAAWPLIHFGVLYGRARYGIDLWRASPADSIRATHIPVLLIHGAADDNIPPRHSRTLHALNPAVTELWEVPRAGHIASLMTEPEAYRQRVLDWFSRY